MTLCQLSAIVLFTLISVELLLIYLNRDTLAVLFPRRNPVKELRKLYEERKKGRSEKYE
jgi:shikimate kinase